MNKKKRAERDALVAKYVAKIPKVVASFLTWNRMLRYLADDMRSYAAERVVYAANRHVSGKPMTNVPGYMHQCIMTGIRLAVREDKVIQKPRDCEARRDRRVKVDRGYNRGHAYITLEDYRDETPLLDACCEDDTDIDILKLTYRGFGNNAISRELGITVKDVKDRKTLITTRLAVAEQEE